MNTGLEMVGIIVLIERYGLQNVLMQVTVSEG